MLVPASRTYFIGPVSIQYNRTDITFAIEGSLVAMNDISQWRVVDGNYLTLFTFFNCSGLTIKGRGELDGQGYVWWWHDIFVQLKHSRPHMINFLECQSVRILDVFFRNSARFHIRFRESADVLIDGVKIKADMRAPRD